MTAVLDTLRKGPRIYGYAMDCRACSLETVYLLNICGARSKDRAMAAVIAHNRDAHR